MASKFEVTIGPAAIEGGQFLLPVQPDPVGGSTRWTPEDYLAFYDFLRLPATLDAVREELGCPACQANRTHLNDNPMELGYGQNLVPNSAFVSAVCEVGDAVAFENNALGSQVYLPPCLIRTSKING